MKKRAILSAKGEVQKVGYRDFVQKVARNLGIVGYVENMRDGSVQIVCEDEESAIEEFTKAIKVKVKFIDVEEVNIVETGEATGEFEYFDIKRGDMTEELGERLDVAVLHLDATKDELKDEMRTGFCAVKEEVNTVGQKVENVGEDVKMVGEKIDNLTASTKENFNELGDKYHVISENMETMNKNIEKMVDALTLLVKEHVERDKQ